MTTTWTAHPEHIALDLLVRPPRWDTALRRRGEGRSISSLSMYKGTGPRPTDVDKNSFEAARVVFLENCTAHGANRLIS